MSAEEFEMIDLIDRPGPDAKPFETASGSPIIKAWAEACMSSVKMDWQTPPEFLKIVRKMGRIGLDPCTTVDNPVCADNWRTEAEDGLGSPWTSSDGTYRDIVFVNPPYGRGLGAWSDKMAREAKRGAEIIGLVPARTDTKWWRAITTADAICFWRGKIKFVGAPNSAPFPSAVPYWGPRAQEFRRIFEPHGWVVFSKQTALFPL